jgi:hypothetical protein
MYFIDRKSKNEISQSEKNLTEVSYNVRHNLIIQRDLKLN